MAFLDSLAGSIHRIRVTRALARYRREGLSDPEIQIMLALDFPPPLGSKVSLLDRPSAEDAPLKPFPRASRAGQTDEAVYTIALAVATTTYIGFVSGFEALPSVPTARNIIVLTLTTALAARANHIQRTGIAATGAAVWGLVFAPLLSMLLQPFGSLEGTSILPIYLLGALQGVGYALIRSTWVRDRYSA